jgi:hypothetical protein
MVVEVHSPIFFISLVHIYPKFYLKPLTGSIFALCTIDPDGHILPISIGHALHSECKGLWKRFLAWIPGIPDSCVLMDRDKGGLSATTELGISNRLCVVHFLDNVSKLYSVFFFILSLTFIYFVFILS